MQGKEIFAPFIGMMILTFVVWVFMYVRRISFLHRNKVYTQKLTTPERLAEIIPEQINYPSYNLKNLFELPVVFYALCLYLFVTASVDETFVIAAWTFLGLRILHSANHCTVNNVMLRFLAYMAAALALWFMVLRAALFL